MKALLLKEYLKLELADLPQPQPGPHEVLVRVAACGICGSDVHGYDGTSGRRIPPIVMGHEAAGLIAATGSDVTRFKTGDRVTFDSNVVCGRCRNCLAGRRHLCAHTQGVGVNRAGAFAEYIAIPERILYRLPDAMSFPEAAMLEAVSVALHGVHVSGAMKGQTALVVGAGMIGLLTMQAARAAGCARVMIADIDETRLNLARTLGADEVLRCSGAELTKEVLRLTDGIGVDVVLEAVGRNETIAASIDCVRKGGTVTLIGNITPEVTLPLQKVVSRQIRLQGSAASSGEYPEAIDLVASGKIQVKPMITAIAPLEDGPRWFERLYAHEPNLMKVVLTAGMEDSTATAAVGGSR